MIHLSIFGVLACRGKRFIESTHAKLHANDARVSMRPQTVNYTKFWNIITLHCRGVSIARLSEYLQYL